METLPCVLLLVVVVSLAAAATVNGAPVGVAVTLQNIFNKMTRGIKCMTTSTLHTFSYKSVFDVFFCSKRDSSGTIRIGELRT
jgi:hypothetical protein